MRLYLEERRPETTVSSRLLSFDPNFIRLISLLGFTILILLLTFPRAAFAEGGLGGVIGGVAEPVADTAQGVTEPAGETPGAATEPVTQPVGEAAGSVTEPVGQAVGAVAEPVSLPVNQAVGGVAEPVGQVTSSAVQPVSQTLSEPIESVTEPIVPVTEAVGQTVEPVAGPVGQVARPALKPVSDVSHGVVAPAVEPIVEPIRDIAANTVVPIARPVTDGVEPIVNPVREVAAPVVEGAEPITKPALEPVEEIVEGPTEGNLPVPPVTPPKTDSPETPPVVTEPPVEADAVPSVEAKEPGAEPVPSGAENPSELVVSKSSVAAETGSQFSLVENDLVVATATPEDDFRVTSESPTPVSVGSVEQFKSSGEMTSLFVGGVYDPEYFVGGARLQVLSGDPVASTAGDGETGSVFDHVPNAPSSQVPAGSTMSGSGQFVSGYVLLALAVPLLFFGSRVVWNSAESILRGCLWRLIPERPG